MESQGFIEVLFDKLLLLFFQFLFCNHCLDFVMLIVGDFVVYASFLLLQINVVLGTVLTEDLIHDVRTFVFTKEFCSDLVIDFILEALLSFMTLFGEELCG